MARKIAQRINEMKSIDKVEEMIQYGLGRCHRLSGNRNDQYAVDLIHPYRMVFIKDGINNSIQIVKIISIEDYH